MTSSLLGAGVVLCLCAGLWGQAASSTFTVSPPAVMDTSGNHARDPVGFQPLDKRASGSVYSEDVVNTIRERWYQLVSELRKASYDRQGITVVEFRVKRDGSLKIAIAEKSGDRRLDSAALNAVRSASTFPFQKDFTSKSIGFRVHLGYNQPIPGESLPDNASRRLLDS
jgi:TonB family protein